jgi:hypothetical protein
MCRLANAAIERFLKSPIRPSSKASWWYTSIRHRCHSSSPAYFHIAHRYSLCQGIIQCLSNVCPWTYAGSRSFKRKRGKTPIRPLRHSFFAAVLLSN